MAEGAAIGPFPATRATGSDRIAVVAVVGLVACVGSVLLAAMAARPDDRALAAVVHGLIVGLPVGIGLAVLGRRPGDRFAWLLVTAGLLLSLTVLAEAHDPVPYSIGRLGVWLVEPLVVYLLLAFPSGRHMTRLDRGVALAAVLLAGLLYVPTALVTPHFPEPNPWATCGVDCPRNAFALTDTQPAVIHDVVRPVREVLTVVLYLVVAAILYRRARSAAPLMRQMLIPVIAVAAVRPLTLGFYFVARGSDPLSSSVEAAGWVYMLSLPVVALGFAAGFLEARIYVGTALRRLALGLREHASRDQVRAGMAEALEDPRLEIFYREAAHGWVDEDGVPAPQPESGPGRAVTAVRETGRPVAAIVHDEVLSLEPALLEVASAYALVVLENERLLGELRASLRELSESRARILAVGDHARREIERDLHDGAQQRLVALRIRLSMEGERLRGVSSEAAAALEGLGDQVEATIDEVRSLARGIYPPLLSQHGLVEALRGVALDAPVPTTVHADGVGRYSAETEATIYFACMEALQNAVKHADGARGVAISLTDDGRLRFEVRDEGAGFAVDATPAGGGLTNLQDRLGAIGGTLTVESAPGEGTCISGSVPVEAPRFEQEDPGALVVGG